jgi:Secretion system C-terminal sorting domain
MKQHLPLLIVLLCAIPFSQLNGQCSATYSQSITNIEISNTYLGQSFVADCIATIDQITVTSNSTSNLTARIRVIEERVTGQTTVFIQNNITIIGKGSGSPIPTVINLTELVTPKPVVSPPGLSNIIKYYFTIESDPVADLKLLAYNNLVNFQSVVGTAVTGSLSTIDNNTDLNFEISLVPFVALPVQLLSFDGEYVADQIALSWKTTNEVDFQHFEVEHRINETPFKQIGIVKNSNKDKGGKYQFFHNYPSKGVNYYRLKQVDNNGSFTYSQIISVSSLSKCPFTVYPNPSSDKIYFNSSCTDIKNLKIYNINGQIVYSGMNINDSGNIDVSKLPKGIYFVEADTQLSGGQFTKFIKN